MMFSKNWMHFACRTCWRRSVYRIRDRSLSPTRIPNASAWKWKSYMCPVKSSPCEPGSLYLACMGEYSLGDAMRKFLQQSQLKGSIQALQIEEIWEQIMGKTVARYTDKIQIHGQTLYVNTSVAPLRQELLYQKDRIIEMVNEALGDKAIKEVVIR